MKLPYTLAGFLLLMSVLIVVSRGYAEPGARFMGTRTMAHPAQAKLWFHDGAWWAILPFDGDTTTPPGQYFYKLEEYALVRQALVDDHITRQADVLWNGTYLFALTYKDANSFPAKLYKYHYNAASRTYTLLSGFPVALRLPGDPGSAQPVAMSQDRMGRLRIAYETTEAGETSGRRRVIWATVAGASDVTPSGHGVPATRESQ
jgi:hypothetical protein